MSPGIQNSRAEGSRKRRHGVLTLASKGARRFLTDAPGAFKDDARKLGLVLEDGDVTWHTEQPRGRFAETSSRVLVTLARKSARRFLTVDRAAKISDKILQLGAVGENGDVTWHSSRAEGSRKRRQGGYWSP